MSSNVISKTMFQQVDTITIPATDHFDANISFGINAEEIQCHACDNFCDAFMGKRNKIETNVPEARIRIQKVVEHVSDLSIIAGLGGEKIAETTLAQMFKMLKNQSNRHRGVLSINYNMNNYYIRDIDGVLWRVGCNCYYGPYWNLTANEPSDQITWDTDYRVISH